MSLVAARGLTKRFGATAVLDGVDLEITEGASMAVFGPSGGGKSTLLRCMLGFVPFDAGEVEIRGARLSPTTTARESLRAGAEARRQAGMIFQDFRLFPHLTALENVAEAPVQVRGVAHVEARDRARALLDRVGLLDRCDAYPRQLSGGEQQRVAIARALAMQPRALFCDEPTSSLDPDRKLEVVEVLEGLRRDGMTLLLVTHEVEVARRLADHAAFLVDGRLVERGATSSLLDAPGHPRLQRFLRRAAVG